MKKNIEINLALTVGEVYFSTSVYKKPVKGVIDTSSKYKNKKYTGISSEYINKNVQNGKYYEVEFSSVNPEHSRMIFENEYIQQINDKLDTIFIIFFLAILNNFTKFVVEPKLR